MCPRRNNFYHIWLLFSSKSLFNTMQAIHPPPLYIPSPSIIKQWSWHFDRSLCNHINFCPAKTVPFVSKLLSTQPAILWSLSGKYAIWHEILSCFPPREEEYYKDKGQQTYKSVLSHILNRAEQHLRNTHIWVRWHICKIACRAILSIYHSGDQIGISMARYVQKRRKRGDGAQQQWSFCPPAIGCPDPTYSAPHSRLSS